MIIDKIRDKREFIDLFNERPMLAEQITLDFVLNNPHIYCFYEYDKLLGCIFITEIEKKLFLNGFAKRGIHSKVQEAIIAICNHYDCDMYSNTDLKYAKFTLLRAGFTKVQNNLFRRKQNGKI